MTERSRHEIPGSAWLTDPSWTKPRRGVNTMTEKRKLTAAEADVLCARHHIIATPLLNGTWRCEELTGPHTMIRPTYAGAVQAVCDAAGLDMTVDSSAETLRVMLATAEHERDTAQLNIRGLYIERDEARAKTARLDREDPRASTIETWCLAHGGCYVECEGEQPTGYRWVAGKEPHGPDDWHPTARAAMDAYEAEQKPKADPECVALLRWWRHCEQFGASVSEWTLQFGASQEMNNAGPSHRLVFRHVAGIWCGSPFHALRGWYASWLETDEAWLAAEVPG